MKRLLLLSLLIATPVHGEIFTWTDGRGTSHYTNSMYEVPTRYRDKVKVLNLGIDTKTDQPAPPPGAPSGPSGIAPQQPPAPAAVTLRPEEPAKGTREPRRSRGRVRTQQDE
jgi:hypothetical protein